MRGTAAGLGVLLLACSAGLMAQDPTVDAAAMPGADAGAKINAADAQLGAGPGTIVVSAGAGSQVTTPVILHGRHALRLNSAMTWTVGVQLPAGSSGQDVACTGVQTVSFRGAGTWIDATQTSGVTVHDCSAQGTRPAADEIAVGGGAVSGLTVKNNSVRDMQLVGLTSTARSYADANASNESSRVTVTGNKGHSSSGQGVFIHLEYTNGGTIAQNQADNYYYGIYWWGGDSCVGRCTAGGDGAAANPRKVTGLAISGNRLETTQACIWGSMGQGLTISGNTCSSGGPGTGDTGIDLEGTNDSTVTRNTVRGFQNGSLATFFLATGNTWTGNVVQNAGGEAPIGLHNATNDPAGLVETFTGNTLSCAKACQTLVEAIGSLTLNNNVMTNVAVVTGFNVGHLVMGQNRMTYTAPVAAAIRVTSLVGTREGQGSATITGNTIVSNTAQGADAPAISVSGTDFNQPQRTTIQGNVLGGSAPFGVDVSCEAASGNSAGQGNYCTITGNTLARNRVLTPAKANTKVFGTITGNVLGPR